MKIWVWLALGLLAQPPVAFADDLTLTNGDKVTGTVGRLVDGKLTFNTALAGTITVDVSAIRSVTSASPVRLVLKDGTRLEQPIAAAGDGRINVGGLELALSEIAAINPPIPPKPKWEGNASLGLDFVRSNLNSDSMNATIAVRRDTGSTLTLADAAYILAKQSGVTSTETWFANANHSFARRNRLYAFVNGSVRQDRIQNLDLRTILGGGLGYEWVKSADFNFRTEGGLAWLREDYSNADTRDKLSAQLGYLLDKRLWDGATLRHSLTFLPELSDLSTSYTLADLVLEQSLGGSFFANLHAIVDYNTDPAPNSKRSTSRYLIGLGKRF